MIATWLGCLDVFAALVMLWSALRITGNAGILGGATSLVQMRYGFQNKTVGG